MLFHRVTSLRLSLYPFPFFPAIFAFIRLPMQRVTRQSETTLSLSISLFISLYLDRSFPLRLSLFLRDFLEARRSLEKFGR